MALRLSEICIDAHDPEALGAWWCLGAHNVDVGQGDETWAALADPEGNEFSVPAAQKSASLGAFPDPAYRGT